MLNLNQMENQVRKALTDYVRHTHQEGVVASISDAFIERLVYDNWQAKKNLREIFRRIPTWNEQQQFAIVRVELPYEVNYRNVRDAIRNILGDKRRNDDVSNAIEFFCRKNGENCNCAFAALNKLAPKAYRSNKPVQRIFQDFCKALGVHDSTKGSIYQKEFAKIAYELTTKTKGIDLILSLNPAHFLTISNPICDSRGETLISCHSLNRTDYDYGSGNIGYARDEVTFVAFTVKDVNDAESLNNRKTSRQLFMYKGGVLLQSRFYGDAGGVYGENVRAECYREIVQDTISKAENAVNIWGTDTYYSNKWGIYCYVHDYFTGYADWIEFKDEIKICVRADVERPKGFTVGESSLCVVCGEENYDQGYCCEYCDHRVRCECCGELIDEEDVYYARDAYGNEIAICSNCAEDYRYCEECGELVHCESGSWIERDERWVCDSCIEDRYTTCDDCGELVCNDDVVRVRDKHGDERWVCPECAESYSE